MVAKLRRERRSELAGNVPILILVVYSTIYMFWNFSRTFSADFYFRQRNVIRKVDEISELIPFEKIDGDYDFQLFAERLKLFRDPPYIIFNDLVNVDQTLNHICNLSFMPNALDRLAIVSFDEKAFRTIINKYPTIPHVLIDLSPIKEATSAATNLQNHRYIRYQLILLMRARICAALASRHINFWAMQQDTLWVENFSRMQIEHRFSDALMLFDTVGNDLIPKYKRMQGWICGSTFFVRGTTTTFRFFQEVDRMIRSRQSPDSTIMTYLCGHRRFKCQRLPKWIISSSNYFIGPRDKVPVLIQIDSDQKIPKMQLFEKSNFIFRFPNGTCDQRAVLRLRDSVKVALPELFEAHSSYEEGLYDRIYYSISHLLNIDRYNNKRFLRVHESLI